MTGAEPLLETATEDLEGLAEAAPRVALLAASKPDLEALHGAGEVLDVHGVLHEQRVLDPEGDTEAVTAYCRNARLRGLRVLIAGCAPGAPIAELACEHSELPVLGVPLANGAPPAGRAIGWTAVRDPESAARLALRILRP
jgi:5-(carboxyamino)imidazole ribonucleotide mutase